MIDGSARSNIAFNLDPFGRCAIKPRNALRYASSERL